ncbi:MAG: DNA methyltransferase [Candidatus Bipolaricaulis anaerobius]
MTDGWKNKLYFGDNLPILREYVPDESVDLIYLDPPFNSKATYNVLFAEQNGTRSQAQIKAFDDTWHWGMESEEAFHKLVTTGSGKLPDLMDALRRFLGTNDMMAYLTMMAIRLVELRRVLKPTGSIYLHCDPTASHYLKIVMDAVFGGENFRNEIVWDYTFRTMHLPFRLSAKHDVILFYAKTNEHRITTPTIPWTREDIIATRKQRIYTDDTGREWVWMPGGRGHSKSRPKYLDDIIAEGKAVSDVWHISTLTSSAKERLGYPTQKPEALLERIIQASSNEGDLVLDPFCGCGTTIAVAERLKRRWIGIDITHLAITLMRTRLRDTFGPHLSPYEVIGAPTDLEGAKALAQEDRYQFQLWALGLVEAHPYQEAKGADKGVDGVIRFFDDNSGKAKKIIVQVKSGGVQRGDIAKLGHDTDREGGVIGAFVTLQEPTEPMKTEAASAGFYEAEALGKKYPKIQIITIAELLAGKELQYPRLDVATFKKAPHKAKQSHEDLGIEWGGETPEP